MNDNQTYLFIFILIFISNLVIFGNVFDITLTKKGLDDMINNQISVEEDKKVTMWEKFLNGVSDLPIIKQLVPLFKIMTFQYSDDFPAIATVFLDVTIVIMMLLAFELAGGFISRIS